MSTSPAYVAAITELAADIASGNHPGFELENQASAIGSRFGVDDRQVHDDVAAIQDAGASIG